MRQPVWCEDDGITLRVVALNASARGVLVRTANPRLSGRPFRMSLTSPRGGEIVARVEAVWSRPSAGRDRPGMGLRILDFERGEGEWAQFVDDLG